MGSRWPYTGYKFITAELQMCAPWTPVNIQEVTGTSSPPVLLFNATQGV